MSLKDLKLGDTIPGDCGNRMDTVPEWMDFERFNRGRQFFLKHTTQILLYLHLAIAAGLSVSNILDPLVFTGKSDTAKKAFVRYYKTFLHVGLWHVGNVWEAPEGNAHKSVKTVRNMHNSVARRMNTTNEHKDVKIIVSQYDMALVQCAFFGPIIMYPDRFGIKFDKQELEDYIFFWRGIGYLLGIDDKFNICSGTYEDARSISEEIKEHVLWKALQNPPKDFERMADVYVEGSNIPFYSISMMSKESLFAFFHECLGLPVPKLGILDSLRFRLIKFGVFMLRWFPFYAKFSNYMFMKNFHADLHLLKL